VSLKHRITIIQASNGNKSAQKRLYELYQKAMFNTCFRIVGSLEIAEEVLQDAFVEAFLHLKEFDFRVEFGAWLKRIAINKSLNANRKRYLETEDSDDYLDHFAEENTDEGEIQFEVNKVIKAIQLLPDKARTVFSLYLLEGYDHEEIAQIMDISISTSKTQFMRAKNFVRETIKSNLYER